MIEIPLTQNQVALIDDEDFELVAQYKWRAARRRHTDSFYAVSNIRKPDGKWAKILMHRLIMNPNKGEEVDHIHHLTLDNRKSELRLCTVSQNQHNAVKRADNTSGYKGVNWNKQYGKWRAQIQTNGKRAFLGLFLTPELANAACVSARAAMHGAYANNG